ncbi:MAG: hypothetical protein IPI67_17925 [Myxococcales bacterium]|nr:hypothetical protein [Myxococcales bacterium]
MEGAGGAQRRDSAASNDRGRHQSGKLLPPDAGTPYPGINQPLRWQGRWFFNGQGIDLYDFRNRVWSPELGAFLSPDEFGYATTTGTLWSWPGQNPIAIRDPSGNVALWAAGAVVGGVANLIAYSVTAPTSMSWGQFLQGAAGAAAGGALAGALATVNPAAAALGGAGGSALDDLIAGRSVSAEGVVLGALLGPVGGLAGEQAGVALGKGLLASKGVKDLAKQQALEATLKGGGEGIALAIDKNQLQQVCESK